MPCQLFSKFTFSQFVGLPSPLFVEQRVQALAKWRSDRLSQVFKFACTVFILCLIANRR